MSEIQYSLAGEEDILTLVNYRVAFLLEIMGPQTEAQIDLLTQHLENYFRNALRDKIYICWLAVCDGAIVGVGGMTIRVQPGNFKNPNGRMGYIMNMYTIPSFRRQGICNQLMNRLMDTGRAMGIQAFELHATKDGEPVYQKIGFEKHHDPTYRRYD